MEITLICTGRLQQVWVFSKIPWVLKNRFFLFGCIGRGHLSDSTGRIRDFTLGTHIIYCL